MLTVTVIDSRSKSFKPRTLKIASWLLKEFDKADFALDIFIVGDAQMPKNVLSFPASPSFPRPDLKQPPLGEIYLNPTYIAKHDENFEHMLIHGFLHLLGYDHIKKNDRMVMERRERLLLRHIAKGK